MIIQKPINQMSDEEVATVAQKAKHSDTFKEREYKNELLRRYKSFLDFKASAYRQAQMPSDAIKAQAYKIFFHVIDTFDPKKPVLFKTYLDSSMVKLSRYVNQNKDIVRIPEQRFLNINVYQTAKEVLTNLKDREPSNIEMADYLKWSLPQVDRMESSLTYAPVGHEATVDRKIVVTTHFGDRWKETKEFVYVSELTPIQQNVYDYSTGSHGKPVLKVAEISKKLNLTQDKVYSTIRNITALMDKRMR